ncbi:MAG: drug/metabolite exporter YedA [Aureliella sp.]
MQVIKSTEADRSILILLAFAAIYLIWGTTYLAMRIAVESLPPFFLSAVRFLLAGGLTFGVLRLQGCPLPTWQNWKSAIVVGNLLMVGGNGLTIWAVKEIPSGVAALMVATMPLWMAVFDWLFYAGPKLTSRVLVGLSLGLAGILLLVRPDQIFDQTEHLHVPSLIALLAAPIFWSLGSLHSRRMDLPSSIFMTTALHSICGGVGLMLLSLAVGEQRELDLANVTSRSLAALAYLAFFGSLVALTAYSWLLRNVTASRVSSYTFVNPVIAVFLGWLVLGEQTSWYTIGAVLLIVLAVVLIVMRPTRDKTNTMKVELAKKQDPQENCDQVSIRQKI